MIHISIDYTGTIPGLGRGPFTNIAISHTAYARLKAIGYPIKVLSTPKIVRNTVVKKPAKELELVPIINKEEVKNIEIKTEELNENIQDVDISIGEVLSDDDHETEVVKLIEDATVPEDTIEKINFDSMTKEELEELLNQYTTERPVRYGKPWLIKSLKKYI